MSLYEVRELGHFPMLLGGAIFEDPDERRALEIEADVSGHPKGKIVPISTEMIDEIMAQHQHDLEERRSLPAA